ESKATLDAFVAAMKSIAEEAKTDPDKLKAAPTKTPVKRLDETKAARNPVLKYKRP
ncbi:MAG: aminomethyl-transferring glycine dehydrogenase subunit GcvPB, partial [Limnochordia bacterium]